MSVPKRVCILGAGGIGSVVGGMLSRAGHDVTLVDPWFEHIAAIQVGGLTIKTAREEEFLTHPRAIHFKDMSGLDRGFDLGFVAVNAYDTEWAAVCVDRVVVDSGSVVCFQNCVCDDRIAAVVGPSRTMGVIMTISAAVYDPGVALRTDLNAHAFKVGELDGRETGRARELADMLGCMGPTSVTPNLWGQRWSKLIINCMNNALAGLTGWKTAATRMHRDTQRIGIQLAAEVVRVARAEGQRQEEVMGLSPQAILDAAEGRNVEAVREQLSGMAARAGSLSRPSFGQDVLKKRRTEIGELNGFVSAKARKHGIATPFCDLITDIVTKLGVGFEPSPEHIKPLVDMLPPTLLSLPRAKESKEVHDRGRGEAITAGATVGATAASSPPADIGVGDCSAAESVAVAGVGAGYFSQFHYDAWARLAGASLVGVCDTDASKARGAVARHGLKQELAFTDVATMLRAVRPRVLDIITPPATHLGLVRLAIDHGVPCIICQKPLAPTLVEAEAIVTQAEAAGVLLVVHENFRFQPWFVELRRLLREGVVGQHVYSMSFRLRPGDGQGDPPAFVARQPYFQRMKRFIVHETGIHFIDVFRFLLGEEVCAVYADLERINPAIAGEDAGTIIFNFASKEGEGSGATRKQQQEEEEEGKIQQQGEGGEVEAAAAIASGGRQHSPCRAVLDCNRLVDHDAEDTRLTMGDMLIEGCDACVRLDGRGRIFRRPRAPEAEVEHVYGWSDRKGFAGDCVFAFQAHVVSHLLHHTPLANDGRAFLRNMVVEEAIYASAERGQRIPIAPPPPPPPPSLPVSKESQDRASSSSSSPRSSLLSAVAPLTAAVPRIAAQLAITHGPCAELGEGPIWDHNRGRLLWCDILGAAIFSLDPITGITSRHDYATHTKHISTVVPVQRADDRGVGEKDLVLVGTTEGVAIVDLADPDTFREHPANGTIHGDSCAGTVAVTRMNEGKCDPWGRFWVGSVAKSGGQATAPTKQAGAALYVLDGWTGRRGPVKVVDRATIANGICWWVPTRSTADHHDHPLPSPPCTMFWIDSDTRCVDAFDFDPTAPQPSALATRRRQVVDTSLIRTIHGKLVDPSGDVSPPPSTAGLFSSLPIPDGCALDDSGCLWVAMYGGGEVRRYDPRSGALLALVVLPPEAGLETTAVAWGGEGLDDLFITTAAKSYTPAKRAACPHGGALFCVRGEDIERQLGVRVRGIPAAFFRP